MEEDDIVFKEEAFGIVGACFEVHNQIGSGFLEAVYQECLALEFSTRRIPYLSRHPLRLSYKHHQLQQLYVPDFICYGKIIIEIKAAKALADEHKAQIINYLKASGLHLGILVNFGGHPKLEYQRFINIR